MENHRIIGRSIRCQKLLDSAHIRLQKISKLRGKNGLILLCKIRDALQILLFSIYNKNLQKPATETYNVSKGFLPPLTTELFQSRNEHPYNLRYVYQFNTPSVNIMCHGTESISFLWPNISNLLPNELKKIQSLKAFKNRIKSQKPEKCPSRICKIHISNVEKNV